jgi:hypothetical protein
VTDLDDIKRGMLEMHNHVFNEQRRHRGHAGADSQPAGRLLGCAAACCLPVAAWVMEEQPTRRKGAGWMLNPAEMAVVLCDRRRVKRIKFGERRTHHQVEGTQNAQSIRRSPAIPVPCRMQPA